LKEAGVGTVLTMPQPAPPPALPPAAALDAMGVDGRQLLNDLNSRYTLTVVQAQLVLEAAWLRDALARLRAHPPVLPRDEALLSRQLLAVLTALEA
jgi:hypothetical protein